MIISMPCDRGAPAIYPAIPVFAIILEQALRYPKSIAVCLGDQELSYGTLLAKSQGLASLLQAEGVKKGSIVSVCLPSSPDLLVAILGIWQLGAIYCPLDPTHPESYMQHMLEQADPQIVLMHSSLSGLSCLLSRRHFLLDSLQLHSPEARFIPEDGINFDSPAYIFFTSGTTGKPKGVLSSHRNLAHYIHVAQKTFAFDSCDVFIAIARSTFSISLFALISPLCVGAKLILTERHETLDPARLLQLLSSVTVLHAGPSLLSSIFRYIRSQAQGTVTLSQLRHVSSGGDIVSASIMEEMKRVFSHAEIYVLYGSTEISCMGTYYEVSREQVQTNCLVGRPFSDVKLRILNDQLEPQEPGIIGEIAFAGPGLTLGYYQRQDLEKDKFVQIQGERYYRMGDLGRLLPCGNLEMLGRQDFQIQLHGIRIELVGIENTIRELGLADQCALVHQKDQALEFLIAILVGPKTTEIAEFRRTLAKYLPESMLPHQLIILEQMPLTVNGKLDRRALQELPWQSKVRASEVNLQDKSWREKLIHAFARSLHRENFTSELNFFDEGGHSLLAVLLLQNIREEFQLIIPPHVFFAQPTVDGVLAYLQGTQTPVHQPIPINNGPPESKLFVLAGVQTYRPLAKQLEELFAVYAVFTPEELSATDANSETLAIVRLSEHYLKQIRAMQPHGPYRLLGYSFAGIVAFEVAQRLRAAGEKVSLLVLIDAIIPEWDNRFSFRLRQLLRVFRTPPIHLLRFLQRRLLEKMKSGLSELNQFREDPKLSELGEIRVLAKSVAAVSYSTHRKVYPDPCLLIVSGQRLRDDPLKSRSCSWSKVIPALTVRSIDGDHFKMVEQEPYISEIAAAIRQFHRP